jgi:hypothetical protein
VVMDTLAFFAMSFIEGAFVDMKQIYQIN